MSNEPENWRQRWNEPVVWPALPPGEKPTPVLDLAGAGLVLIDVDKKSLDRQIVAARHRDPAEGDALAARVYDVVLPNWIQLVEAFRAAGKPVLYVQWGWHRCQYPPLERREREELAIKQSRGAFPTSDLDAALKRQSVQTCCFAGADTAMCVASTVRGAIDRKYRAVMITDACLGADVRMHEMTLEVLAYNGALLTTTAEVLATLATGGK